MPGSQSIPPQPPTRKPKRARVFTPKSDEAVLDQAGHKDISELTGAVRDLAKALKPLEALAEHVPTLVEMASVWNAGKSGGRAAWRAGDLTGAVAKWITAIGGAIVFVWLMLHARWDLIVKAVQP